MGCFFYRTYFPLFFTEEVFDVRYTVCHASSVVEAVGSIAERRPDGTIERWQGYLVIRDFGDPGRSVIQKTVYVAHCNRDIVELPDDAGFLIGEFTSEHGIERWAVFLRREPGASRPSSESPRPKPRAAPPRKDTSAAQASAGTAASTTDGVPKDKRTDETHADEPPLWPL